MKRREFITLLGGAAAAWPLTARAQQGERVRRVGLLVGLAVGDPEVAKYSSELREALRALGWIEGKNLRVDYRAAADLGDMRSLALELANLGSELVVTYSTPAANAVRQAAPWMPIVFTAVSDPIGTGFVESFARPGGIITGFTNFEASGWSCCATSHLGSSVRRCCSIRRRPIPVRAAASICHRCRPLRRCWGFS